MYTFNTVVIESTHSMTITDIESVLSMIYLFNVRFNRLPY